MEDLLSGFDGLLPSTTQLMEEESRLSAALGTALQKSLRMLELIPMLSSTAFSHNVDVPDIPRVPSAPGKHSIDKLESNVHDLLYAIEELRHQVGTQQKGSVDYRLIVARLRAKVRVVCSRRGLLILGSVLPATYGT
jgi:hypothetical protein